MLGISWFLNRKGMNNEVALRLREFIENEARACSMDFGSITPLYVYRMWGGDVALEEIEYGLDKIRQQEFMV